jgi:DNA repair protein RecO (recombination protein O)
MALSSACAVCATALPEREPHPGIFDGLLVLLENLHHDDWPTLYVKWEVGLLGDLGFGLDLSECAATGTTEDLIYISPKSGRAVSSNGGMAYKDRLLPLPGFLLSPSHRANDMDDIAQGLRLTGFFLNRHAYHENGRNQPDSRSRFVQAVNNQASKTV